MPRRNSSNWAVADQVTAARLQDLNEDLDDIYSNGSDRLHVTSAISGTALKIDIGAGTARVGTINVNYAGAVDIAVTNSATNYVQIDSSGTIQISTSGWTDTYTRLAIVVCAGGVITSVTNWKNDATGGDFGNVPTGTISIWPVKVAPANNLLCYGQAVSRTTYAALYAIISPVIGTFTVTIASPAVFSKTAHGLGIGDAVFFTTTGALPTGLSINTLYYVITAGLTADAFEVSATRGGSAVNTSGSQSGTHTATNCPYGLGDGTTTFNIPDLRGRFPLGKDNMGDSSANRVTHIDADALGGAQGAEAVDISHTHNVNQDGTSINRAGGGASSFGYDVSTTRTTGGMNSNSNPTVMNPWITMSFIIKT